MLNDYSIKLGCALRPDDEVENVAFSFVCGAFEVLPVVFHSLLSILFNDSERRNMSEQPSVWSGGVLDMSGLLPESI